MYEYLSTKNNRLYPFAIKNYEILGMVKLSPCLKLVNFKKLMIINNLLVKKYQKCGNK